ncbi:MAG: PAS domain S-box protein [Chitinophagaceae bacterium]
MNKLLQRQLQKHFGKTELMPENLAKLLKVISESYDHYEKDRKMIERSIELSSKEMIELNSQIKKNGKAELEKAHNQLKTLFENIEEVFYSVDMVSYKLLQISAACEKVYGYTSKEFLAAENLWQKVIHPEDRGISEQQVKLLNMGKQVSNQYRIIHKDGNIRWIENKIIPTLDETGRLLRIDGVTHDISERKQAEKKLEESFSILEATIESTADGILVIDFEGKIIRFNKKFVELWRIPKEILDMRDDNTAIAYVSDQLANPEEFVSGIKELYARGGNGNFDILKFKDGRIFERYSQPQLINGQSVGRVISFRDITEQKKAEEAIAENEKRLRQIIDLVPHFIFAKNANGKFILANKAVAEAYGCKVEDLIGKGDSDFNSNNDEVEHFIRKDLEVIKSGSAISNIEETITDAAGNARILSTTKIPYNAPGADIPGLLGVCVDISERKKAETVLKENEGQLSIAAQIAKLGYWEFDVLKGLFTFNDQFYAIFKTTAEELGGYTMTPERYAGLFVHPDDAPLVGKEVADAINSPDPYYSRQIEHRIRYANGEAGYMAVRFFIVKDEQGRTIKTFGANQDITERKKGEETLKISEVQLELKNKELEQKNKELEQFAYVASHDLQEPLRTTSSFAELLQRQYRGKLDEKADKYLTFINQSSDRMKNLIKDLLDYSRIGRKKELEQVDCNIVLQEVLADITVAIKETQAEIKSCRLPVIKGNPTEIKQLFQNLVINAIKFKKENESPRINICARKKNHHWEFSCADNGIGISNEHSERIFVIFQRLHTRNEYEGSGIGLAHCKKIVELHGGRIWVESVLDRGSTFYFTIPATPTDLN